MSNKVLTTTLAAFACAAVVSAQAPPPAQQPPAPNTPPPSAATQRPEQKSASDNLIVTGCLERRTAASIAPGPAGAPASNDAPAFVLTKVMRPTGTAGSTSAAAPPASYRLDADDSKLSGHVGEKVEITGMLAARADNPNASSAAGADGPRLKVDSVKMIAKTCTE